MNTVEKKKYAKIRPRWDVYIGVNLLAPTGEIGYNVQKCSVLEKNNFCHWNDILLAPVNTVEKKK